MLEREVVLILGIAVTIGGAWQVQAIARGRGKRKSKQSSNHQG